MRRAAAPVRIERGGHFRDAPAGERRLDHQLAGELHAGRAQIQSERAVAVEAAQPAVKVADTGAEEEPAYERQYRIAEVAMQPRHCAGADAAAKPVAHDER